MVLLFSKPDFSIHRNSFDVLKAHFRSFPLFLGNQNETKKMSRRASKKSILCKGRISPGKYPAPKMDFINYYKMEFGLKKRTFAFVLCGKGVKKDRGAFLRKHC